MSETYHSASTMAWPGEEETDFNFKPPAWEILGESEREMAQYDVVEYYNDEAIKSNNDDDF